MRAHHDAVLALFEVADSVVSVAADGQLCSLRLGSFGHEQPREIASYAGDSVVGCHLESSGERLWLALEEGLKRIAALTACHAAVKANYPLTFEKMAHILDELAATAYSTVCPHGRPVMLRLTRREIEKNFERI